MEDIVRGAIGLATEGFFEAVETGSIAVRRDRTITRLLERDGKPCAELDDGTVLPADLVVCATGFTQGVPFLPSDVQSQLWTNAGTSCCTGRSGLSVCPASTWTRYWATWT